MTALRGEIKLVDVSLRDGNQSLWGATGITTRMIEGVAPLIDRVHPGWPRQGAYPQAGSRQERQAVRAMSARRPGRPGEDRDRSIGEGGQARDDVVGLVRVAVDRPLVDVQIADRLLFLQRHGSRFESRGRRQGAASKDGQ